MDHGWTSRPHWNGRNSVSAGQGAASRCAMWRSCGLNPDSPSSSPTHRRPPPTIYPRSAPNNNEESRAKPEHHSTGLDLGRRLGEAGFGGVVQGFEVGWWQVRGAAVQGGGGCTSRRIPASAGGADGRRGAAELRVRLLARAFFTVFLGILNRRAMAWITIPSDRRSRRISAQSCTLSTSRCFRRWSRLSRSHVVRFSGEADMSRMLPRSV
jgi:hypothetical protein